MSSQVFAKSPYKLKKGDVISAEHLNRNFEHLERSIYNDNLEYAMMSQNKVIGYLRFSSFLFFRNDYRAVILYRDGTIKRREIIYFSESDCSGDTLYSNYYSDGERSEEIFTVPQSLGHVTPYQGALYYYAAGETDVYRMTPLSRNGGVSCENIETPAESLYLKYKLNDPAITGIETYPFPLPITGAAEINIVTE